MARDIIGWRIDERDRAELLRRHPPTYPNTVANHVTFGPAEGNTLPDIPLAQVIGRADDDAGVEALVVELAGSSVRPTGGTYHITWSLAPGRKAVESNDVIRERGWQPIGETATVRLQPARWP